MDKRLKQSHNADMWDYRHGKLLLDLLAGYSAMNMPDDDTTVQFLGSRDNQLMKIIAQLSSSWGVNQETSESLLESLANLAKHALEHGREEVQTRKTPMDNPLDYPEK